MRFCRWIADILHLARVSILVHGSPLGYLACTRRVRQSDPLSPLLFGLVEDSLSRLLTKLIDSCDIARMLATRFVNTPTHIFYADDLLMFFQCSISKLCKIVETFAFCGAISWQHINWDKFWLHFGASVSATRQSRLN